VVHTKSASLTRVPQTCAYLNALNHALYMYCMAGTFYNDYHIINVTLTALPSMLELYHNLMIAWNGTTCMIKT